MSIDALANPMIQQFSGNHLEYLVRSGGKGSWMNVMPISCLVDQQELKGKRSAMMPSARTRPSFRSSESSSRVGGFADGDFFSGLRPVESFVPCLASREGWSDPKGNVARIASLQLCLMKHREGRISNDHWTVMAVCHSISRR